MCRWTGSPAKMNTFIISSVHLKMTRDFSHQMQDYFSPLHRFFVTNFGMRTFIFCLNCPYLDSFPYVTVLEGESSIGNGNSLVSPCLYCWSCCLNTHGLPKFMLYDGIHNLDLRVQSSKSQEWKPNGFFCQYDCVLLVFIFVCLTVEWTQSGYSKHPYVFCQ